jgi:hypothetical protein
VSRASGAGLPALAALLGAQGMQAGGCCEPVDLQLGVVVREGLG